MLVLNGKSACEGIAIAEVFVEKKEEVEIEKEYIPVEELEMEIKRWKVSMKKSKEDILELKKKLFGKIDNKELDILMAHVIMLDDPMYVEDIEKYLRKNLVNAEYAVKKISEKYINLFEKLQDPVYAQRKADIKDISERILSNLLMKDNSIENMNNKIYVGVEINPSTILKCHNENIKFKGLVLEHGGETSHAAILAKTLGVPTLMGVSNLFDKTIKGLVILDSRKENEKMIISPDLETLEKYKVLKISNDKKNLEIEKANFYRGMTKDGVEIGINLNVGGKLDLIDIEKYNPDGIGLLRTEMMYMEAKSLPSEEEQFNFYKKLIEKFTPEKEIIIRTLDIGADKMLSYLPMEKEENPFLGVRGIRYSLKNIPVFKSQIKAILRVANGRNVKIMYPMVTKLEEIRKAKEIVEECKLELKKIGKEYKENIQQGVMIEVPSSIIMADVFSTETDFFSVGSNDLTQYILAADRLSKELSELYDSYEPSVLRLIYHAANSINLAGKKISVCGELAGEELGVLALLSLGIKDFSMVRSSLGKIKKMLKDIEFYKLEELRKQILVSEDGKEVKKTLNNYLKNIKIEV
ncbi:MAG: phosphoenolpyruvate--protein phosphotransferase [Fusobacteriaceae bacterium]